MQRVCELEWNAQRNGEEEASENAQEEQQTLAKGNMHA